jgi:hypothetical protein
VAGVHERLQDHRVLGPRARSRARRATHHPGDLDATVLERLAQALDRVAAKLGELVEEQDTVV